MQLKNHIQVCKENPKVFFSRGTEDELAKAEGLSKLVR